MARIGRSFPSRPIVHSRPRYLDTAVTLGAFQTDAEFPDLSIFTPGVALTLDAFQTDAEFPDLLIRQDRAFTLGAFQTDAEFPDLTLDLPVLPGALISGDFQIEWAGVVFGGYGNIYQVLEPGVEGWDDLPEVDSGDAARSARHGSWTGRDFAQARPVSATIGVDGPLDNTAWVLALRNLRRVLSVSEDGALQTLTIRTKGEVLLANAKVQARVMPVASYSQGWTPVSVRWVCPDPRRLDLQQQSVLLAAGDNSPDLCTNDGDIAASPRIKIRGPVTNPVLVNVTLDRILRFAITVQEGQLLQIDTDAGTVLLDGEDAMDSFSSLSVPIEEFILAAGDNLITYEVTSGGEEGAEVQFRSSYL